MNTMLKPLLLAAVVALSAFAAPSRPAIAADKEFLNVSYDPTASSMPKSTSASPRSGNSRPARA